MKLNPLSLCMAAALMISAAHAQDKGYVFLSAGACDGTRAELVGLQYRTPGPSIFNYIRYLSDYSDELYSYEDETGRFQVSVKYLEAGEWEIYNHMLRIPGSSDFLISKTNYSFRFTVLPGKALYLGRYCAASQDHAFVNFLGKPVRNPKITYILVSKNLQRDREIAATREPEIAKMEVVDGAPAQPSRISPIWRATHIEPRVVEGK